MRIVKLLGGGAVALATMGAGQALAADLFLPPPPPEPAGCLYARLDGAARFHDRPNVTKNSDGEVYTTDGEKLKDTGVIEGGIGCAFTDNIRADVTAGYAFESKLRNSYGDLDADHSALTGFVNVYYDVADFGGVTPYVGGGIGVAYHRLSDVEAPVDSSDGSNVSFAWNLQAGVSFDVAHNVALDIGYRYVNLGRAKSGGPSAFKTNDIDAHEARVGVRIGLQGW